jgi:hypothetical protein
LSTSKLAVARVAICAVIADDCYLLAALLRVATVSTWAKSVVLQPY